jgi:bacterioferritin (cytochrome b1)
MQRVFYRKLWDLRFRKMLKLELTSAEAYRELLAQCRKHAEDHAIEPHLQRLIADEERHARLVRQLVQILRRQKK